MSTQAKKPAGQPFKLPIATWDILLNEQADIRQRLARLEGKITVMLAFLPVMTAVLLAMLTILFKIAFGD